MDKDKDKDNILKDSRFSKLVNDPRYRQIPNSERKVKLDKRFQSMFDSDKFKVKYAVDKRGRPLSHTSSEDLAKYYQLHEDENDDDEESEEEELDEKSEKETDAGKFVRRPQSDSEDENDADNSDLPPGKLPSKIKERLKDAEIDYARGEGVLLTDSSSDEESSEEVEDDLEHDWGELDADAEKTDEITPRLAICNMDWDNIKAADLFVLLQSFLPPGGSVKNVIIYPSEYGLKRMREEESRGPIELTEKKLDEGDEDSGGEENDEGSKYHMEKLRKYQLNRLKYYYAIAVFDSEDTANHIYTECDGIEYESSATRLDLRFVSNDTDFDEKPHDECYQLPDVNKYKPRLFTTTALQQARVQLTWDASNPHRSEVLKSAADGDIDNEDLRNYLACSSSDEGDESCDEKQDADEFQGTSDPISKYKMLLEEIEQNEEKKKNRDVEMEITWGLGLKEKTAELVKKKLNKENKLTPFEEMIEKQKQKKKEKRLEKRKSKEDGNTEQADEDYSSDDVPSDIDMNDPYFAEEFEKPEFKNTKNNKKSMKKVEKESDSEEDARKRAELELLLDDDEPKISHFSLKKIQKAENQSTSKKKLKKKNKTEEPSNLPDFNINVEDERFSALYTSHHFNIDPTDPNFKKTKAMDKLIEEKLKRRPKETDDSVDDVNSSKKPKLDPSISMLVKSLKRKSGNKV